MPTSGFAKVRLLARIAESTHELTINYPAKRPDVSGSTPGIAPVSPLSGKAPVHTLVSTSAPDPFKDPVTMQCLWTEVYALGDVRRGGVAVQDYGWVADADVVARVNAEDAENEGVPGTVFEGAAFVEHAGKHYRVLSVVPHAAGTDAPHSYSVWLRGAWKN